MNLWLTLLIGINFLCWGVFVYFLRRRHWSWTGLFVGVLHMFVATPLVLGPFRALFGQSEFHYQVGYLEGSGAAAFAPALALLAWALGSAWLAVAKARGKWMLVGALGDALMAVNVVGTVFANRTQLASGKIQAGEFFTITGGELVSGILIAFATPLVASSIWAFSRVGNHPPVAPGTSTVRKGLQTTNEPDSDHDGTSKFQRRDSTLCSRLT